MEFSIYLFAAFSVVWTIIFIYTLSISRRQKSLEKQIDRIRKILEDASGD